MPVAHGSEILFIGLGAMGSELACRLVTPGNHGLTLHDTNPASIEKVVKKSPRNKPFDVASSELLQKVVFTCLPSSDNVGQVLSTLLPRVQPGTIWIDCTSGDPIQARKFADLLGKNRSIFVDVGVSGGPRGAAEGSLGAMVGCPAHEFEMVQRLLHPFAKTIIRCGDTGAGHAVKAVNNLLMGTNLAAATEGLTFLEKYGIDPVVAVQAINASSGRSWATQNRIPNHVLPGTYDYGFQLSLLQKDMLTALRLASGTGSTTPILSYAYHVMQEASRSLSPTADHTQLCQSLALQQSAKLLALDETPVFQPLAPSLTSLGIKMVVFDCAGTIIDEGGLVYNILQQVMQRAPGGRIIYTPEEFNKWHGANKIEALRFFGLRAGMTEEEVQTMYADFLITLKTGYFSQENEGAVKLIPGVLDLFKALREAGIKVCLNTGYPHSIADRLLQLMGLEDKIDGLVVAEDVGMGRPYPYMVQYLARKHAIMDMRQVAKLGDSIRDIEEGRFAGCGFVGGVLTGADGMDDHLKAGADLVLNSVADLRV